MKIVMVLTSHDVLGSTGRKTGFWLEEFAAPYFVFRDAGIELTLASPKGGQPPIDPKSDLKKTKRLRWRGSSRTLRAQKELSQTVMLETIKSEDYDTIFYVGGHGPMWDLAESRVSIALLESFYNSGQSHCVGLPLARRAAPRDLQGRTSREGKARDGIYQRRGRSRATDPRRAVPCRRRADAVGSHLREGRQLAAACGRRWSSSHWPESCVVHTRGAGAAQTARKAKRFGRLTRARELARRCIDAGRRRAPVGSTSLPVPRAWGSPLSLATCARGMRGDVRRRSVMALSTRTSVEIL